MADAGAATIATLPARPIVFLAMAGFVSAATLRSMDPLVPAIAGEFATTPGAVGLTVTAFAQGAPEASVVYARPRSPASSPARSSA